MLGVLAHTYLGGRTRDCFLLVSYQPTSLLATPDSPYGSEGDDGESPRV